MNICFYFLKQLHSLLTVRCPTNTRVKGGEINDQQLIKPINNWYNLL